MDGLTLCKVFKAFSLMLVSEQRLRIIGYLDWFGVRKSNRYWLRSIASDGCSLCNVAFNRV